MFYSNQDLLYKAQILEDKKCGAENRNNEKKMKKEQWVRLIDRINKYVIGSVLFVYVSMSISFNKLEVCLYLNFFFFFEL